MKSLRILGLLLFALLFSLVAPPAARAQDEGVSFDYFYDNLSPYGEWVEVADYGLSWHPTGVAEDWAPYTDGYWAYTDAGWTWVSYEDFGGIVYHYGRWVRTEDEGWCWVPDTDWGPAWVSWRNNDDYIGWAPLPPEAHFEASVGFSTWVDDTYDIGPDYYHFCHVRDFSAPVIREVCLPRTRNYDFCRETVNITNITVVHTGYGGTFCGGPRYDFVSRHVFRPIPALKLVQETNITNITNINIRNSGGGGRGRAITSIQRGNTLIMPAPRMRPIVDRRAPVGNVRPTKTIGLDKVNRGWGRDRSQADRDQYRTAIRQQNKGATPATAPARAITAAEVKDVPTKADPNAPSPIATSRGRGNGNGKGQGMVPGARGGATPGVAAEGKSGREEGDGREAGRGPGRENAPREVGADNGSTDADRQSGAGRGGAKGRGGSNAPQITRPKADADEADPSRRPREGADRNAPLNRSSDSDRTPGAGRNGGGLNRPGVGVDRTLGDGQRPGNGPALTAPRVNKQPFREPADADGRPDRAVGGTRGVEGSGPAARPGGVDLSGGRRNGGVDRENAPRNVPQGGGQQREVTPNKFRFADDPGSFSLGGGASAGAGSAGSAGWRRCAGAATGRPRRPSARPGGAAEPRGPQWR